jgi:hypothetical protein
MTIHQYSTVTNPINQTKPLSTVLYGYDNITLVTAAFHHSVDSSEEHVPATTNYHA